MKEYLSELNPDMLTVDGFDDAIIGYAERCGMPTICAYDVDKCIEVLMKDGCSYEEAMEYFDYNILGAYMGENTPIFITKLEKSDFI